MDGGNYLLELTPYVVLNPVHAGMVSQPDQWPWSSYQAMAGQVSTPSWLATDSLLNQFGERRRDARRRYQHFVREGIGQASIWGDLRQQVYLGDDNFVERMQDRMQVQGDALSIPKRQRRAPASSLTKIAQDNPNRNDAIIAAYEAGAYSYREIAAYHGVHLATVGRIVRRHWMQQCEN